MAIDKISAVHGVVKNQNVANEASSFKAILENKRADAQAPEEKISIPERNPTESVMRKVLNEMVNSHDRANDSVQRFMAGASHSPKELLEIQYVTGEHFTKVQMVSKAAELSANTIKNFSQTPI